MDFTGFTFNGKHSSQFGIVRVSDGSRYQDSLIPTSEDYTTDIPGGDGQYYFGSNYRSKQHPLSIAFDSVTEKQIREMRRWLGENTIGDLIFDERPYKVYKAKTSGEPQLNFICFNKSKTERVYKGEGTINFVSPFPFAYSKDDENGDIAGLQWYRDQIEDVSYKSVGNTPIVTYKIDNEVAVIDKIYGKTNQDNYFVREKIDDIVELKDKIDNSNLFKCAVHGVTTEAGSGEKGPENPYTVTGAAPTALTVCGRNLLSLSANAPVTSRGVTFTPLDDGYIRLSGTCTADNTRFEICPVLCVPAGVYTASFAVRSGTVSLKGANGIQCQNGLFIGFQQASLAKTLTNTAAKVEIRVDAGTVCSDYVFAVQLEPGTAVHPYVPYTGQTVPLPTLSPLYGDGTVCDEYDAVTGVETRRWGRVTLDGSDEEVWSVDRINTVTMEFSCALIDALPGMDTRATTNTFRAAPTGDFERAIVGYKRIYVSVNKTRLSAETVAALKVWLDTHHIIVIYQLAAPIITQHDPTTIKLLPAYQNIFSDSGLVGVNYKILNGKQISTDIESPSPDYPAEISGQNPTKISIQSKNLLNINTAKFINGLAPEKIANGFKLNPIDGASRIVYIDCDFKKGFQYYITFNYLINQPDKRVSIYLPDMPQQYLPVTYDNVEVRSTFTANINSKRFGIYFDADYIGSGVIAEITNISVYLGNSREDYTPFSGVEYNLPSLGTLYGNNGINDEYSAITGKLKNLWSKIELDGSSDEAWGQEPSSPTKRFFIKLSNSLQSDTSNALAISNRFPLGQNQGTYNYYDIFTITDNNILYISISISGITDIPAWRVWLQNNQVTILYQLESPIITEIPLLQTLDLVDETTQELELKDTLNNSSLIVNSDPNLINYFTDSNANLALRIYPPKYPTIEEWAESSGLKDSYSNYNIYNPTTRTIKLSNSGDREMDWKLTFTKPVGIFETREFKIDSDHVFSISILSSTPTSGLSVSNMETAIANLSGTIEIDTSKGMVTFIKEDGTRIPAYFLLKKGSLFKIPTSDEDVIMTISGGSALTNVKMKYNFLYY